MRRVFWRIRERLHNPITVLIGYIALIMLLIFGLLSFIDRNSDSPNLKDRNTTHSVTWWTADAVNDKVVPGIERIEKKVDSLMEAVERLERKMEK